MRILKYMLLSIFLVNVQVGITQELKKQVMQLPIAEGVYVDGVKSDWLVNKINVRSGAFRNAKGNELILSNGLLSRTFRITPNATTVSLKKLTKQEELIRAVKPEATIVMDDFSIDVGGLEGQSNLAFLFPDWIDSLRTNPKSFSLKSIKIGEVEKRMEWKEIRHHDSSSVWPPKGIHLTMTYGFNELSAVELSELSQNSKTGRTTLIKDDFTTLSADWKITKSESHERSSFINEGKAGEIYTPKNTAVYAERMLPAGVHLVETTIDPGTDYSSSWAPGIALIWNDTKIKFTFQRGNEDANTGTPWKFVVFDGTQELKRVGEKMFKDFEKPWKLRLRIDGNEVFCEAQPQGEAWRLIHTLKFKENLQDPIAVRIGKLGKNIEGIDHTTVGPLVRLNINEFAAYSDVKKDILDSFQQKLSYLKNLVVDVNYEMYDAIPLMSKWVNIQNNSSKAIKINNIVSEYLALAEHDPYHTYMGRMDLAVKPNIHIESDYSFSSQKMAVANIRGVHWSSDQDFVTQINLSKEIPNQVKVYPENGYNVVVETGKSLESIRSFEMPFDTYDKERKGLSQRKIYRIIAPWVTENPMMFHLRRGDFASFKRAIDQCAETGYEMLNFSFGSGFNAEDRSEQNLEKIDRYLEYSNSKGIGLGFYSLLASRSISEKDDVINPKTGKRGGFAKFGNSPCLGSEWGLQYFDKMKALMGENKMLTFTHDGSYPGDRCASEVHPGHLNFEDSQYKQWKIITDFYKWCKSEGVDLRIPDYYYLSGGSQNVIGYREANWSLPRREQLIFTRQYIYDGTWESTPSMRWSFIPLSQYGGGGEAATIEPLNQHLEHYELILASSLGMGIQSVLRGPRLYDTDETKDLVTRMVAWYKKYRAILESDIIHLKRADGRDIDYMMHVNPHIKEKGFLMVFNPTDKLVIKTIKVPLYYTGLKETASIREQESMPKTYNLDREYEVELEVEIQPGWYNWYVIE